MRLDESERVELKARIDAGRGSAERRRVQILLLADEARPDGGRIDADIAALMDVSIATVERVRRRCLEAGLEAINADPRPVKWRFTAAEARIKLHSLHPSVQ